MRLLEYEAKTILREYNIPVPDALVVTKQFTPELQFPVVLKSQVPTGGRGKAGGVVRVNTPDEMTPTIDRIFALTINGFVPSAILAEQTIAIKTELYLSLFINRDLGRIELMAHTRGGVEVERETEFGIWKVEGGKESAELLGQRLAEYYELPDQTFALQDLIQNLMTCFIKNDATLLEINPLVLTDDHELLAADCKMELDNAAHFRHPEWNFEDTVVNSNFVELDKNGTVATIANGAGLAMATVDAVSAIGLQPANFLDIGGGASSETILGAFHRIMELSDIKVIVINIFAGITRCDEVARAIIVARKQIPTLPPLCIRLAGTNFEQAVAILSKEGIPTLATLNECLISAQEIVHG